MSSKRSLPVAGGSVSNEPPSKKALLTIFPPINLGPISTEEELDLQVVKIQNKKLYARLEEKNALEDEYKSRIAELEKIHKNDQIVISTLNLTWNRLDEDVRIMLQRFEEIPDDDLQGMSETTVEFLEKLSNRTSKGIEEEVQKRAAYSTKIASRLIKAIETSFLLSQHTLELLQESKEKAAARAVQQEESDRLEGAPSAASGSSNHDNNDGFDVHAIELAIKLENSHLKEENSRLHALAMSLQDQHNSMSVEYTVLRDKLDTLQKELNEANTRAQDTDYDLQKANKQVEKLIKRISDMQSSGKGGGGPGGISSGPTGDKHADELELQTELAASRLTELEALQKSHVLLAEEYEKLKQQSTSVPDEVVVSTTKYKMLQTQFNILFTDAQTIRRCCEEARKIVTGNRNQHIQQIEQLESENASMRKRVRAEISQLEVALTDTRKELEQLRVEYEHNMKAHEQIGPMAKEMRHLINSLQNHNQQLKGEVQRFKRKLSEALDRVVELEKMKKESGKDEPSPDIDLLEGPDASPKSESSHSSGEGTDSDDVKFLRTKLKAARQKRKEMKLLLDMYKGVSKETRTKAELLKNEQMLKEELAAQKAKLAAFTKDIAKQSRKMAEEEAQRSIKKLNDMLADKDRQIANTKQEEDALLSEMEFTGQAFEEMQEQNLRLMQQLREKDDANLKLMSEKIKANQLQKLLREEKEVLTEKISALTGQRQSSDDIVRCLEEREKVLQSAVANLEKEMTLRQQAVECHKRKAVEVGQQCQELMFKLENLTKQLDELKSSVVEKTNRLEEEMFKVNRIQEENMSLKKKLDRAKKMEYLGASDEILVEEVKMYKGKLQCPCCNTRPKDAILTKCFHVFCFECLKTRYDTRQRKCPKCNATFGNNDFHKIYM